MEVSVVEGLIQYFMLTEHICVDTGELFLQFDSKQMKLFVSLLIGRVDDIEEYEEFTVVTLALSVDETHFHVIDVTTGELPVDLIDDYVPDDDTF